MDGVADCVNGEDEVEGNWEKCGSGISTRFVTGNSVCEDVFLCRFGPTAIIPPKLLCDGINTCGSEDGVCQKHVSKVFQKSIKRASDKWVKYVAFCQLGLERRITEDCGTVQFTPVEMGSIFGIDKLPLIHLPYLVNSCKYFFGEQYVYLACTGRCGNTVGIRIESTPSSRRPPSPSSYGKKTTLSRSCSSVITAGV
eukprot:sb/3470826/